MNRVPYQRHLKDHLGRYKRDVLGVLENGTWSYRGRERAYAHILPKSQYRLNIVENVRDEFWRYWERQRATEPTPAKLHRDFAHLNSSQALAFNVFFPFLGMPGASPQPLLRALGAEPEEVIRWRFEHVLDHAEETNFDVFIGLQSGRNVLVEVKLGESGFGRCSDDPKYHDKLGRIYRPALTGKVVESTFEPETFFTHYQILRNLSYVGPGTRLVFLVPRANDALKAGLNFIADAVLEPYRSAVSCVYLEDLLAAISSDGELGSTVRSIGVKYLV